MIQGSCRQTGCRKQQGPVGQSQRIVAELEADEAERKLRRKELKERDLKIDADAWSVAQKVCK